MCMMSVIYDQFKDLPDDWYTPGRIELFHTLTHHAKLFDEESSQPDCLDPEKAKLDKKIEQLEFDFELKKSEDDYKGADND